MSGAGLARGDLAAATRHVLSRGHGIKPDVLLVASPSGTVVVKDYAPRRAWVRRGPGRWLARREQRLLTLLRTLPEVPRLLGPVDPLAFAIEYRPGERLSRELAARRGPAAVAQFLERLEQCVERMHALGVVHLDLRHRDNVLMDEAARPVVLDLAAGLWLRPGSLAQRWLQPGLRIPDRRALAKWRDRLRPGAPPSPRSAWRRWRARRRRRARRSAAAPPR